MNLKRSAEQNLKLRELCKKVLQSEENYMQLLAQGPDPRDPCSYAEKVGAAHIELLAARNAYNEYRATAFTDANGRQRRWVKITETLEQTFGIDVPAGRDPLEFATEEYEAGRLVLEPGELIDRHLEIVEPDYGFQLRL